MLDDPNVSKLVILSMFLRFIFLYVSYHFKYKKKIAILIKLLSVINNLFYINFSFYNTLYVKNKDYIDKMKNLDCNQIKIFINLEIIEVSIILNFKF